MARKKLKLRLNYYLISGILLLLVFGVWRYHNLRILSFASNVENVFYQGFTPTHIKAYPVGVDIKILPSKIENGVWTIHSDSAGFIRNGNNTIIYGHNKDSLMGPIRYIKPKATIELTDDQGQKHIYEVVKTDTVKPDNLRYIGKTESEILTVYTCIGFLDSLRFVVVARPLN